MFKQIVIDPEFKELIPPLMTEDHQKLEESVVAEGCRDALVVWNNTLIDGHNRYEICQKHGLPFKTTEMQFNSRNEAMLWMINNQLARRNLSAADRIILAGRQRPILESIAKERRKEARQVYKKDDALASESSFVKSDNSTLANESEDFSKLNKTEQELAINREVQEALNDVIGARFGQSYDEFKEAITPEEKKKIHVRDEIAKLASVSSGTVAKFEKIQKQKPELIEEIRTHKMSIDAAYNAIKTEQKKKQILNAEQEIQQQVTEDCSATLYIGDGIAYTPEEKYDLLLTDPPYSTDVDDIETFVDNWLYNALDNVKDTGFAYVFIGAYPEELKAYLIAEIPKHITLCQQLIWTYKNTLGNNPNDRYKQNYQVCLFYRGVKAPDLNCPLTSEQWAVQEINAPDGRQGDRYHAWQKPMEIAERFIRHSTEQGMSVFDPFACTGTFLLAAARLGRKAYGFEINPENARIAFNRGCVPG